MLFNAVYAHNMCMSIAIYLCTTNYNCTQPIVILKPQQGEMLEFNLLLTGI